MKIVYRVSEQDFLDARNLFVTNERPWYRRLSRRLLPSIGAFVLAAQVWYLIAGPHRDIRSVVDWRCHRFLSLVLRIRSPPLFSPGLPEGPSLQARVHG